MTKLTFLARLKTWGVDYPVDAEGNVQTGKPPSAYHVSFYILGAINEAGQEVNARSDPACKNCIPEVSLHFAGSRLEGHGESRGLRAG